MLQFNCMAIDATRPYASAYKINTAFYEAMGPQGWYIMEQTRAYIGSDAYVIADAKRGDIGNTAKKYAQAFLSRMQFDAITLSPYMGLDSLEPYLDYPEAGLIVLGATSNSGAAAFQDLLLEDGQPVHLKWMRTISEHIPRDRLMFVVGATQTERLQQCRQAFPRHTFLTPGLGAQGGDLEEAVSIGWKPKAPLLINVSRAILYPETPEGGDPKETIARSAQIWSERIQRAIRVA